MGDQSPHFLCFGRYVQLVLATSLALSWVTWIHLNVIRIIFTCLSVTNPLFQATECMSKEIRTFKKTVFYVFFKSKRVVTPTLPTPAVPGKTGIKIKLVHPHRRPSIHTIWVLPFSFKGNFPALFSAICRRVFSNAVDKKRVLPSILVDYIEFFFLLKVTFRLHTWWFLSTQIGFEWSHVCPQTHLIVTNIKFKVDRIRTRHLIFYAKHNKTVWCKGIDR